LVSFKPCYQECYAKPPARRLPNSARASVVTPIHYHRVVCNGTESTLQSCHELNETTSVCSHVCDVAITLAEEVSGHEGCLLSPSPRELCEQWIVVRMILQLAVRTTSCIHFSHWGCL